MKFPYGLSDFSKIILGGYFYQDRTDRIPLLESAGDQLIFIRPRRFGKSLLLSMLDHYYDVNRAGQFDALFGHLTIGQHPTPLHNQYFVMKWDFSLVKAQGAYFTDDGHPFHGKVAGDFSRRRHSSSG